MDRGRKEGKDDGRRLGGGGRVLGTRTRGNTKGQCRAAESWVIGVLAWDGDF